MLAHGFRGMLSGFGAIVAPSITTTGTATLNDILVNSAGTASTPSIRWAAGRGIFDETSRIAIAVSAADKMYVGATIHHYVAASFAGSMSANNVAVTAGDRVAVTSKTANYTAVDTDRVLLCDPTSGSITITLPAAGAGKQEYVIKKTVAHANTLVIDPAGAETINGAATLTVADNTSVTIVSDGTNWHTISAT